MDMTICWSCKRALSDAKYAPEMRPFMKRWDKIKHEVIATDLKYHDAVELVKNIS